MWAKIKNSFLITIILCIVAVGVSIGAFRLVMHTLGLRGEYTVNQEKIAALTKQKQELEARLEELTVPAALEREAKARLNLKLPGEEVVVVVPEEKATTSLDISSGVWGRAILFFKKLFR